MDKKNKSGPGPAKKLEPSPEPPDDEIADDFAEREDLSHDGRQVAQARRDRLDEHHAKSPELSAGDVPAAWDRADSGEQTVSGHAPAPDQDVVDEIGAAAGLTYADDDPDEDLDDILNEDDEEPEDEVEENTDELEVIEDEEGEGAEDDLEDDDDELDFLDDEDDDEDEVDDDEDD
jgi:hypothetical protein